MSAAPAPRGGNAAAGYLSIGQVLARLSPEFPALTSSKLRFLEDQGIVTPMRTETGYRKFSPADLGRLRTALTLQRDHYLPLARIREYLDENGDDLGAYVPASIVATARRYRRSELLSEAQATTRLLDEAISSGLIVAAESYDERALQVLRSLVVLEGHGIQPRHIRGMRQSAERQVALVESALAPLLHRSDGTARSRAKEAAPELLRRLEEIRASLIHSALERLIP